MNDKKTMLNRIIDFYVGRNDLKETEIKTILDLKNDLKAINYKPCCTTLKDKEAPHFYDWLKENKVDFFADLLLYKGEWLTIGDLYVKYKKEFNIPF